ncbi:preprotein translocase subunit SecE [Terrihabitans sp. B22-R8]|uniref:preprotein translocase subunit SecE n=1 Tax=Terrihabitans sp. B22-R8 TaxID=3425128 RepID=UPI00403CB371
MANPVKFFQEVRAETAKITWPTRRETLITTAMVFVFAVIASIFFLVVDQVLRIVVTFVLGIGN